MDDFNRPDGELGNGWSTWTEEDVEIEIVDNEVLITGKQVHNWWKSEIYRPVEDETRFSFDFKADDNFNVHIRVSDAEDEDYQTTASVYASPGGSFSYGIKHGPGTWSGWTKIPGSQMIAGQYNTLTMEQKGTDFTITLNDEVVCTFTNSYFTRVGEVDIGCDAAAGIVGSIHIDNFRMEKVSIVRDFDFNGDGAVDVKDVVTLTDYWGQDYSVCDISPMPWGDGLVDAEDLLALATYLEQETALIAHWPLDETEGFANEEVGNNRGYVFGGAIWEPTGGQIGGAIRLDGVDGCIIANPVLNPAEGPFSAFAWVQGGEPGQVIVSGTAGANWLMLDAEGKLMTEVKSPDPSGTPLLSQSVITDGRWHRVGLVWDGSSRMLYVDDAIVADDTQDSLEGSFSGLYIGCGKNMQPGTFFSGLIDDVRVYNRAVRP
ncbi:MAG: hypothetical protein AMJ65_05075 [Phycisphaerae bacterium SG8_4]|nr:MAG: hypothetical protein AMJ65_05075 [Phycisphaerae bacterium SG8_4]